MLLSVFTLATCVAVGLAVYNPNDPNCEYTQGILNTGNRRSWNGNLLIDRLHPNAGGSFFDQNIEPMRNNIRTTRWKRSSYRSSRGRNRWNTYRRNRNWNRGQWNRREWSRGQRDNINRWDNGWDSNPWDQNWHPESHY